jgi:hypothetical protein
MGCLSLRMCFSGYTGEPNVVYLTYLPHAEGRKMLICMALLGNTKNCNVRDASHEWRSRLQNVFRHLDFTSQMATAKVLERWCDKVKRETLRERSRMTLNAMMYHHIVQYTKVNANSWLERPASGSKLDDDSCTSIKQREVGLVTRTCHVNGCSSAPWFIHNDLTFLKKQTKVTYRSWKNCDNFGYKPVNPLYQ